MNPKIQIVDAEIGEIIVREMTDDEYADYLKATDETLAE